MVEAQQLQEIARRLVQERFPECQCALLAGSVARNEAHAGSDLDIVVINEQATSRWETVLTEGWPVELFVFTPTTIKQVFEMDARRRWPLHISLCMEGMPLVDQDGLAETIRGQAKQMYAAGPAALTEEEISGKRYDLTWQMDDLKDAASKEEKLLIGHDLLIEAADVYLVFNKHWRGRGGKWTQRMLEKAAPDRAEDMLAALSALYERSDSQVAQAFGERVLMELGGRQFENQFYAYEL